MSNIKKVINGLVVYRVYSSGHKVPCVTINWKYMNIQINPYTLLPAKNIYVLETYDKEGGVRKFNPYGLGADSYKYELHPDFIFLIPRSVLSEIL